MRQDVCLNLHDGGKNEGAIRSASCSRSRWMRRERKFRSRETDQACGIGGANLAPDTGGPAQTSTSKSRSIQRRDESKHKQLIADGLRK
jgi:hypothetical protein